jgi:quercetin dioxygenase-like cupin family protein
MMLSLAPGPVTQTPAGPTTAFPVPHRAGPRSVIGVALAIRKAPKAASADFGELYDLLKRRGLRPVKWVNSAGYRWDWHSHADARVVYCLSGSAVFHTRADDVTVTAGDELDIPADAEHAATVGPAGTECLEVSGSLCVPPPASG